MKQNLIIKVVTESWNKYNRNQFIGGQIANAVAASSYLDNGVDPSTVMVATALNAGLAYLSINMRDKRQKIIFSKVIQKFPNAESMYQFIRQNRISIEFDPYMDDQEYGIWIAKNIVKSTKFGRALAHFFFGQGPIGAIVNGIKLSNAEYDSPEDIVRDRLS